MRKTESAEDVRRWFAGVTRNLWPVAVGSCLCEGVPVFARIAPACASGKGHSSYALYGRRGKRRFSVYMPERLVPEVRAAIQNGRRLQELINEAGARYVRALKRQELKRNR